ncbi:MAG: site-specific DNA-methyltransferase, partial [Nitrospinaceae bacterium]|nr:site-specific DNA-methyltransferase [Nitrospinaceae bacterium]
MTTDLAQSRHLVALKEKLREMFQLDQAELDFGIYRIMNAKRDEVERFLDDDLLPQVQAALAAYQPAELVEKRQKLETAIAGAEAAGIDPEVAPSVMQLRAELEDAVDVGKLEEEVYSHLTTFFSRYYHDGDFMSLRRYKEGVYALPYEGEEVKLHWANADQYYIKTSESFQSYAFKVPQIIPAVPGASGSVAPRRVRFDLVSAGTERDNVKASAGKERRFILDGNQPLAMDG